MASADQDASKDSPKGQFSTADMEVGPPEEEPRPGGEQLTQRKRGKKRRREGKEGKEAKKKNAVMTDSPIERPSRERKSVVRYAATAPRRLSATKVLNIPQGSGEKLKDIPNVTFKLSKRKSGESLRVLHKILFGRKTNVHFLRRNILQFSGFVWSQNEEKERSKVKEKLSKCNKDRLLEYCDLLDIYTLRVTTKKEEISAKLLEFLECPHATREVLLSENDPKRKKSRKVVKGTGEEPLEEASPEKQNKRLKKGEKFEAKKDHEKSVKVGKEDAGKDVSISIDLGYEDKNDGAEEVNGRSYSKTPEDEDNMHEEPESIKTLSDGEGVELDREPKFKEKTTAAKKVSRAKSKIVRSASLTKKAIAQGKVKIQQESETRKGNRVSPKAKKEKSAVKRVSEDREVSRRKGEVGSGSDLPSRPKKDKEKGKNSIGTSEEDGKRNKKEVASKNMKEKKQMPNTKPKKSAKKGKQDALVGPSREKLHAVVSNILKEVDFNVATLADIIKQLGAYFGTDLMHRRAEIKDILEEVINNMSDDEGEDEDGDGSAEE